MSNSRTAVKASIKPRTYHVDISKAEVKKKRQNTKVETSIIDND